jgi:hypothetical protein
MRIMTHTVQGVSSHTIVRRDGYLLGWDYERGNWRWTYNHTGAHYFCDLNEAQSILERFQEKYPQWA